MLFAHDDEHSYARAVDVADLCLNQIQMLGSRMMNIENIIVKASEQLNKDYQNV